MWLVKVAHFFCVKNVNEGVEFQRICVSLQWDNQEGAVVQELRRFGTVEKSNVKNVNEHILYGILLLSLHCEI